jgi:Tol biopolymer transport system component
VAYWSNAEGGIYNLWKIGLDGGDRTQLTYDQADGLRTGDLNLLVNSAPSWSKDGKRIVYSFAGDLWMMDSDGFNPESILLGRSALCPFFSADDKMVYFVTDSGDSVHNLWSLTLSDRTLKKVTQYSDWNVGSPSLLPDGRILFNLYRANVTQVYTMNADGSGPVNLTNDNRSLCPKSAIQGRSMVYCSYETQEAGDLLNVFMAKANGTEPKALTRDGGTSPSWAPDRPRPAAGLPTPVGGKAKVEEVEMTQELTP